MFHTSKLLKKTCSILSVFALLVSSAPRECFADGGWEIDLFSCVQSANKADDAAAKKNVAIYKLLEKAREMRFLGKFKEARAYAQGALKIDKDSKLASSFLDQLVTEEKNYKEYLEWKKWQKEEAKRAKRTEAQKAKEEKMSQQRRAEEEKRLAKETAKKGTSGVKASTQAASAGSAIARQSVTIPPVTGEATTAAMTTAAATTSAMITAEGTQEAAVTDEFTTKPRWMEEEEAEKKAQEAASAGKPEQAKGGETTIKVLGSEDIKLKGGQPIVVNGDKVEYCEGGIISAQGNVVITYGDIKLHCDRIEVDTKTRQALCEGHVKIEQPDGVLTGDRIQYDFLNKRGDVTSGEVKSYPWYGNADKTSRVSEKEFLLKKGGVTTCDLDHPHYRLTADEIRFFPDDKIMAKNVMMYVGDVPVMWLPYYYQPIIEYRAKVQLIPGSNKDWGYFLLSAWRLNFRGKTKADVFMDYRSRKGLAQGANVYYHMADLGMEGLGEGVFRSYFVEQNGWGTYKKGGSDDPDNKYDLRKRFQWKHRLDFDKDTVGLLEFNKMSDSNVLKDYFYDEFETANRTLPSYISIISSKENYIFSFETDKRFNNFDSAVQKMPEAKIDVPDQRLWDTSFYYTNQASVTNFEKQYALYSQPPERVQRADTVHRLTYVTGIGPVNLQPYGEFRETVYSRTKWENSPVARMTPGGGLNAFSQFHKIYNYDTNFANLDINQLRHIFVPGALFFYQNQPTVDKDNLYQMDEIDTMQKMSGIRFSLQNKLQTKRHNLDGTLRRVDLVRFQVYTDYLFRFDKSNTEFKEPGKFTDPTFDLELDPYDWLFIQAKLRITPKNQAVNTGSIEFSLRPTRRFKLDLGYRYEKMPDEPRNQVIFDTSYTLSPKWRLGLYERWDLQGSKIEEQQFTITRDLHCWEMDLVYDVEGANIFKDNYTLWVAFRIKAFPDLQLGLDRSYTKTAPGAMRERDDNPRYPQYPS